MDKETIGLIAGNGKFPILFAQKAKEQNFKVVAAAVRGDTTPFLQLFVDQMAWFDVGELKKLFFYFKAHQIQKVIMAGQVNPQHLFKKKLVLDEELRNIYEALRDRKADTIFTAIAQKLKEEGMELLDSTFLLREYLAPRGTLTNRGPSLSELQDIEFGKTIAKLMGGIDVGQTVVVKEKAIVAIEAMEGTDLAIARGGSIAKEGAVVVKMSKPNQDLRFDIPVIGPRTIKVMRMAHASCLAVEAGKALMIDQKRVVKLANQSDICLVGV